MKNAVLKVRLERHKTRSGLTLEFSRTTVTAQFLSDTLQEVTRAYPNWEIVSVKEVVP